MEALLSVWLLEGLLPVERGEFQDSPDGPAGEQAEQVTEISPGLDAVHLATGEQGDEGGVRVGAVTTTDEKPILTPARQILRYSETSESLTDSWLGRDGNSRCRHP